MTEAIEAPSPAPPRDWLQSYLVTRRQQYRGRAAIGLVAGAMAWLAFGRLALVICAAHTALVALEQVGVSRRRMGAVLAHPIGRATVVALSAVQGGAFCGYAVLAAVAGGQVGIALGAMFISGMLLLAVIISQGSRAAFLASAVPAFAISVLVVPTVLALRGTALGECLLLAGAGVLQGYAAMVIWRLHERLLTSERGARLEAELRRAEAETATAAKARFVAVVSHELRTPITAIQAGAAAVEKTTSEPTVRAKASLIAQAGRMMRALLDDLLDASKIEAGRMTVEAAVFDARALAADAARFWATEARRKGLRFRVLGSAQLPGRLVGDPTRLRQILNNLLSNALKFTDSGAVTLSFAQAGGELEFAVADTGAGMTGEQLRRLFAPFAQADVSVARTHGGTGLGLSISRDLAELMGGRLDVESRAGEGSTFRLRLPLRRGSDDLPAVAGAAGSDLPPLRILEVDDHEINRQAVALILESIGAEVAAAASGAEALERLASEPFDVVLMDLNMPGLDGCETTRRLKAVAGPNRATPVIALTGSTGEADIAACRAAGMAGWVCKPIEPALLFAEIQAVLAAPGVASAAGG